jgi:hypothetical protein
MRVECASLLHPQQDVENRDLAFGRHTDCDSSGGINNKGHRASFSLTVSRAPTFSDPWGAAHDVNAVCLN